MKKVVFSTGYGEEDVDYTETIHLNIGNGTLTYDPYYQQLIYEADEDMHEFGDDDLEAIQSLIEEIEKRFTAFEAGIKESRTKLVKDLFDQPLNIKL